MTTATLDGMMATREGPAAPRRDRRRVLLIGDDRWVRALFVDVLAAMGCEVQAAASGEEGLVLFGRGEYQLVIADLEMGRVGGLEVARAVATATAPAPVIIVTGSDKGRGELEQRLKGCTVLTKPVRLPDFQEAVLQALDRLRTR